MKWAHSQKTGELQPLWTWFQHGLAGQLSRWQLLLIYSSKMKMNHKSWLKSHIFSLKSQPSISTQVTPSHNDFTSAQLLGNDRVPDEFFMCFTYTCPSHETSGSSHLHMHHSISKFHLPSKICLFNLVHWMFLHCWLMRKVWLRIFYQ